MLILIKYGTTEQVIPIVKMRKPNLIQKSFLIILTIFICFIPSAFSVGYTLLYNPLIWQSLDMVVNNITDLKGNNLTLHKLCLGNDCRTTWPSAGTTSSAGYFRILGDYISVNYTASGGKGKLNVSGLYLNEISIFNYLDNTTIVREHNTTWAFNSVNNGTFQYNITKQSCTGNQKISAFDNGIFTCSNDIDTTINNCSVSGSCFYITYDSELDNTTIIRNYNTSWILNNQNYNTTKDIINAINHTDLLFSFKVLWANIENKITKLSELTNDLDFYSGSQVNSSIAEHNKSIKIYIDTQDSLQDECSEITGCIVKTTITGWIDNNKTDILNTLRNDIDNNASYLKSYANSINTSTNLQELGFNTTQQLENYFNTLFMSFFDLSDYWNMSKEKLGINNLTACSEGQILKYTSGAWTCGTDQTGGGGGTGLWDKYPDGWHRLNQSRTTGEDIDVNKINSTEINVSEIIIARNISISSGLLQTTPTNDSDIKSLVNKEYVDFAVTSLGASYYMYDDNDATGYKTCHLDPSSDAETYIEASGLADDDYIGGWISGVGEAPSKLLKGVYDWYITLEKTGTKTLRVYWKLIERKSNDDEVVIATSSNSNEINGKAAYLVPLQLNEDYIPDSGSRIVGKLYADVSGGGSAPTIRVYYQGSTSSRWEIPANSEIFKNIFVPYEGAVKNVDLGSKNLNTTGTIDGGAVKVSGVDVLTSDMDTEAELETQIGGINLITSTELSDKLDNTTIIREHNTSWITKNQNYNTTKDIQNAINNSGYYNIEVSDLSCSGCLAIGTEVVDTGGLADGDDDTTYSASGTLLDLTGTTFSVKEGTLTTGKLCSFDGTNLVCNSDDDDIPDTGDLSIIDTEAKFESELFPIFTSSDGSLNDDDLSDNSINDLADVDVTGVSSGKILKYSSSSNKWVVEDDSDTTYLASGTLLDLTGTTFSIKEGTLTDGKGCKYTTASGLVCDQDYSPLGATIDDTELTAEDFGDFTCSGGEDGCSLNSNSVSDNEIDYSTVTVSDFTNDANYINNQSDANINVMNVTSKLYLCDNGKCFYWYVDSGGNLILKKV